MTTRKPEHPKHPRIGITAEGRGSDNSIILPDEYLDAIRRAGGEPLPLAPWLLPHVDHLRQLDAVVLAGGGDIAPDRYGSQGHPAVYEVDPERDAGEITLLHLALEWKLPVLGICRGAQLINVALGGTLHEHVPDVFKGPIRHRAEPPGAEIHAIAIAAGSRLEDILGSSQITAASWHHQALQTVAPGLLVTAWAEDGCIEAIESAAHPWLVAVQWHPELTALADPAQQRIFNALVAAAQQQVQQEALVTS